MSIAQKSYANSAARLKNAMADLQAKYPCVFFADHNDAYRVSHTAIYKLASAGKLRIENIANYSVIKIAEADRAVDADRKNKGDC